MATDRKVPVNVRKRLAARLEELRGERRQVDVIKALAERSGSNWSVSKLSRIENNSQRIQPDEVEDLLDVYEHDDAEDRAKLKMWAQAARQRGRWQQRKRDIPEEFQDFVEREEAAVAQSVWEPLLVPALCQTAEYASVVITGMRPGIDREELGRRVNMRMARKDVLSRKDDPQELWVILDQGVLTRSIAAPTVMLGQLRHLVELAGWSNITLQVVPDGVGFHPGLSGWFSILEFPDPDDADFAYTDGPGGNLYLEDADDVRGCTLTFGHLRGIALNPAESIVLINRLIRELE